ncbi:hypothetical protein A359_01670 [secondary endosymbiont of Ctenarytaina eucalypti]|uniref:Uncharacterized protein n=1 Tax=secondary endosymbiont of Ctenarytaina eucalypti TaxID=1199245 RepID=J3Z2Y2_9ENTR|nr:hypothetical protein A359_01670 [secondary endosymbiont of Ctenarytaina eucalypti]
MKKLWNVIIVFSSAEIFTSSHARIFQEENNTDPEILLLELTCSFFDLVEAGCTLWRFRRLTKLMV